MSIYLRPSPSHSGLTSLLGGEEQVYYHVGPLQYDFLRALYSGGSAVSATTFYSGSTDLSLLMGGTSTFVQDGNNTFTGGTPSRPTINIVLSPSFASMFAVAVSATTFYSAGTDLSRYMTGGTPTYVQNGSNTFTGGTPSRPSVNVVDNPTFVDVNVNTLKAVTSISSPQIDAEYIGANVGAFNELNASTVKTGTIHVTKNLFVGDPAEEIFGPTYVQPGTNTTTGGTITRPTVDVVADPIFNVVTVSSLDAGSLYAGSIGSQSINGGLLISGGTELSTIILRSRTRVIPGTNITTGGTFGAQTVDVVVSPSFASLSASSLSASTIFSGSADISSIFLLNPTTGTTIVDFGFSSGGEGDFTSTTVSNSSVRTNSIILIGIVASNDHPEVGEALLDEVSFANSDIVDGASFTINGYAERGTWGQYNIVYRIIN